MSSPSDHRTTITAGTPAGSRSGAQVRHGRYGEEGESSTVGSLNSHEGSSSHRSSVGGHPDGTLEMQSPPEDPVAVHQGQNVRRNRTRKGGGFLLQRMFHGSPKSDADGSARSSLDSKGKKKADEIGTTPSKKRKTYGGLHSDNTTEMESPSAAGVDPTISPAGHSLRTSHGYATNVDTHGAPEVLARERNHGSEPAPLPVAPIDPTQIVNMALNLSESRRRNISGGQMAIAGVSGGRRMTSAGTVAPSSTMPGAYQSGAGGSLRQYLQQQRRISRNISPAKRLRSVSARQMSASFGYGSYLDVAGLADAGYGGLYHFSAPTLARAEKAKRHIELSVEFRRLLQFLPPLKPEVGGHLDTSKVPSKSIDRPELGRQYNPLQLIRNRKLRARTRNALRPDVDEWDNPHEVRDWVDSVELASTEASYRLPDKVALPPYPLDDQAVADQTQFPDHRRSDSISRPKRHRSDWYTSPQEMLADAYWLEQDEHKSGIEDPQENPIFKAKVLNESLKGRRSYESRGSYNDSIRRSAESITQDDSELEARLDERRGRKRHLLHKHHDDSTGRFKHILHKARRKSRSPSSDLSVSDESAGRTVSRRLPGSNLDDENVGPLERHMDQMLAIETSNLPHTSPLTVSPGTPDKWGRNKDNGAMLNDADRNDTLSPTDLSLYTQVTDFGEESSNQAFENKGDRPGPTIPRADKLDPSPERNYASSPNSPTSDRFFSPRSQNFSPPTSRPRTPTQKARKAFLPFIRSDGPTIGRMADSHEPFTEQYNDQRSRNPSGETGPRSSVELVSPKVKQLFSHKTNDSLSSLPSRPSSRGKDSKETKETGSGVRRFLKGGRIAEIVRHEGARVGDLISPRRKDSPLEPTDVDSEDSTRFFDESDTDTDFSRIPTKERPHPINVIGSLSGKPARTPRSSTGFHYLDLPTFHHVNSQDGSRPSTPGNAHKSPHGHTLQGDRSSRLVPHGLLDLSRLSSSTVSPGVSRSGTLTPSLTAESSQDKESRRDSYGFPRLQEKHGKPYADRRLQALLDVPGQATGRSRSGLPPTALSALEARRRSPSRQARADKRHWSISDQHGSRSPQRSSSPCISPRDIARVRALLLCSGIKAAELARRAHAPPIQGPSRFLIKASETADVEARLVNMDQEHVVAAKLLADSLEKDFNRLRALQTRFRETTMPELQQDVEDLRGIVESCVDRSRGLSDEAAAFGNEVTGQGTIDVRQVMDSLETLRRARRRRLRWVRRIGFGLLEWSVLLILWWLWLVVVTVKGIWNLASGIVGVVRWVLWLK